MGHGSECVLNLKATINHHALNELALPKIRQKFVKKKTDGKLLL